MHARDRATVLPSIVNGSHLIELVPTPARVPQASVACPACGGTCGALPEATSLQQRGAFALVLEWRSCRCGAFLRTERVARRVDGAEG